MKHRGDGGCLSRAGHPRVKVYPENLSTSSVTFETMSLNNIMPCEVKLNFMNSEVKLVLLQSFYTSLLSTSNFQP